MSVGVLDECQLSSFQLSRLVLQKIRSNSSLGYHVHAISNEIYYYLFLIVKLPRPRDREWTLRSSSQAATCHQHKNMLRPCYNSNRKEAAKTISIVFGFDPIGNQVESVFSVADALFPSLNHFLISFNLSRFISFFQKQSQTVPENESLKRFNRPNICNALFI